MKHRQLDAREQAFITAYVKSRSVSRAAFDAKFPPKDAVSMGCELLGRLDVQRVILAQMPDCRDREDMAAKWGLELDGSITPDVTLEARIQAVRDALAAKKLEGQPSLLIIIRPEVSARTLRRRAARERADEPAKVSPRTLRRGRPSKFEKAA